MRKAIPRESLIKQISKLSVRCEAEPTIKLAAGNLSNFYINIRSAMMQADCAAQIAIRMLDMLLAMPTAVKSDYLGGVATAGIPVVQSILLELKFRRFFGTPRGLIIRTQPKDHGNTDLIEGLAVGHELTGKTVAIVEDTITSAKSVLKAVDAVLAKGGKPVAVLSVVDRGNNTAAVLGAKGLEFASLFKAEEFYPPGFTLQVTELPAN